MIACVKRGITSEGLLCEPLNYYRCAKKLYENREDSNEDGNINVKLKITVHLLNSILYIA